MSKHTPGPWKAINWKCHAPTSVVVERGGEVEQIAECSGFGRMCDDSIADARLISAAPELLLAAQLALADIRISRQAYGRGFCSDEAIDMLKRSIAKATGEQQ